MIRLLVNPAAGRRLGGRGLDRLAALAASIGAPCEVSASAADLTDRARRAAEEGVERLIVGGGDGTVHHVVQGLADTSCALGILPLGTGNDLATALAVPRRVENALEALVSAPLRSIDLGQAGDRYFAIYSGVGFDSEAARRAHQGQRFLSGRAIYLYAVLRTLVDFVPPRIRIEHDEGVFDDRAMFITLANGPCFGGGMRIAPQARLDDGWLDLVIVRAIPRRTLLRVFPQVYRGRHVDHPAVEMVRTRRALLAVDRPMVPFADGEPLASLDDDPLTLRVAPGALRICRP
ncbi:MAG: diacylglycerol kinase family protein [Acidobacteriota bacterium]